tara:strand:+ start:1658 stop:2071 length:414 start_codon:yes stop_codon:yes gene_type:complete
MKIVNRTPHDINLVDDDGNVLIRIPKSDEPIRLESSQKVVGNIPCYSKLNLWMTMGLSPLMDDYKPTTIVDVKQVVYGESNLPDYEEGVYYIVSALVANAYPERKDLLMVNDTVRDDDGRIIGCKSFAVVDWSDKNE